VEDTSAPKSNSQNNNGSLMTPNAESSEGSSAAVATDLFDVSAEDVERHRREEQE